MQHIHNAHHHEPSVTSAHEGHHTEEFLNKFWITLFLTIPIVLLSDLPNLFLRNNPFTFSGASYVSLLFGSVVFFYGGLVFLKGAVRELSMRQPGMMTLIALAISAAYFYSAWSVFMGSDMVLFWELATLITIMLLGHWIEMKSVQGAKGALHELAKLLPDTADVIHGETIHTVPVSSLVVGDIVLVRPGAKVPADGVIIEGSSEINESIITGESKPQAKTQDEKVIAGSINGDGSLKVRIETVGEKTFLASIMRLVAEAESSKSRLQLLSDRAAFYLTLLAVSAGAITFGAWIIVGESAAFALERLVAVLVIACPHALGLAVPLVASISITLAAKHGFFIKRRIALEAARNVTTVLFDKTGTLTEGSFGVTSMFGDKTQTLLLASSMDNLSEHPIAKAIVSHAKQEGVAPLRVEGFTRIPGKGSSGTIEGRKVFVGNASLLEGVTLSPADQEEAKRHEGEGRTVIHVIVDSTYLGSIALADVVRKESKEAVQALQSLGIRVAMITGDAEDVARSVAQELNISEYFARVLPENKASIVKQLQERNEKVAFVGDGINDAPALTQADVGIAIGAGTNVAIESAGIILVQNNPNAIPSIIALSRATYRKMLQNLFWATGYNVLALPIAAGALFMYGIMLDPAVAAIFMSLSTIIVAINAATLKKSI